MRFGRGAKVPLFGTFAEKTEPFRGPSLYLREQAAQCSLCVAASPKFGKLKQQSLVAS